jgi:hypothetical protein
MLHWLSEHQALLWTVGAASVVMFVATIFIVPAIVVRIPADYFAHDQRPVSRWAHLSPMVQVALRVVKNLLGALLILAGIAMLALPGQGLLTLLIGILLIDFPGKYRFEQWLTRRRAVHRALNWLRRRAGREPLQVRDQATERLEKSHRRTTRGLTRLS